MTHWIKKSIYFCIFIISATISVYFFYEWMQEWVGSSSKFRFGLDIYTPFGITTILLPISVTLMSAEKLTSWKFLRKGFIHCNTIIILLGSLVIAMTLLEVMTQKNNLGDTGVIFLIISLTAVCYGIVTKLNPQTYTQVE